MVGIPEAKAGFLLWIDEVFFEGRIEKNQREDWVDEADNGADTETLIGGD